MIYKIEAIEIFSKLIEKLGFIFLPIYCLSFLFPRNKDVWVFGSSFGKTFSGNPKYMYLYTNYKDKNIKAIWISREDDIVRHLRNENYEAYNIYSLKGIYYSLRAKVYIFDHYTKDISFWFSGGAKKINCWHGIPLKKGHRDSKFDIVRNPRNIWDIIRWTFRRIQNEKPSHYYSVTSDQTKKIRVRAFNARPERTFICGYARNDIFFENEYINSNKLLLIDDFEFFDEIENYKKENYKVIIYMPTHRKSEDMFFDFMNLKELNKFLDKNKSIMLVKAHRMSKLTKEFTDINYSNILNINATADPYPYLNISDILITDYSSVYFDFLLTNKSMIFFPYDMDRFTTETMELYYDYDEITPGPKAKDMKGLVDAIDYYLSGKDEYQQDRDRVRDLIFTYNDGKTAERLYNKIVEILE